MLQTVIRFVDVPALDLGILEQHGQVFDIELKSLGNLNLVSCHFIPTRQDDFNSCEAIVEVWSSLAVPK